MDSVKTIAGFECVEMKRQGGERIYEDLKDLTPEERHAYWQRMTEDFHARHKYILNTTDAS